MNRLYVVHGFIVGREDLVISPDGKVVSVRVSKDSGYIDLEEPIDISQLHIYIPARSESNV